MRDVPGNPHHAANARRKPLAPLPDELSGPTRDFVAALRRMHGELGYSLKELEGRLPASRSSLSRYLRGQSLPDERLLVQWCKLSFTGEDRLPALVELLHRANEAADAGERGGGPETESTDGETTATASTAGDTTVTASADAGAVDAEHAADLPPVRRRLNLVLAGLGTAAVLAAAAFAVPALTGPDGPPNRSTDGSAGGGQTQDAQGAQTSGAGTGSARITVHNVEKACQHQHTRDCALGLARDPFMPYRRSNVAGHVWHGDVLHAVCRVANGITVTDEVGGHSSIWFRVDDSVERAWVPGIRIRPEQLENTSLPSCPD
ncbi:helix-turn-helix transcriptional regulator [Streptomyces piniterrae]|uniref:Helix-turn-helix transcriptional regulator n=1 Tax=Streptomyces piniterrae TaxID=2571125 RepID=A0A4U0N8E3_9ACTN|nr:helix-turn-helix transcriptional regulator [Streptomyces piniterrae]TJZ50119.1 helix-turn-helix transcriptional regulator [Streptomyces piniterrae]